MISKPLVSIGMPIYNGEKHVKRALDSLLAQDYENCELVISDNASTDATLQICRQYAERDHRIRIHSQSQNLGIQKNFQTVLKLSQGEYFMWAAVDDYWQADFVRVLVEELNNEPEAGVAMCAVRRNWDDGTLLDTIRFTGRRNPNCKSYLGMALGLSTLLKYNLFIYGVFRMRLIKSALPAPLMESGDRWFLSQFALAARFRYIDRVLHIRTLHHKPYQDRYPHDEFGRIKMASDKRWFYFYPVVGVYRILSHSRIIPPHRKLYLPIILGHLFFQRLLLGARRMVRSCIVHFFPTSLQKRLLKSVEERNEPQKA
jgi:glycosyltransferase involved in cell wall biosynthesis